MYCRNYPKCAQLAQLPPNPYCFDCALLACDVCYAILPPGSFFNCPPCAFKLQQQPSLNVYTQPARQQGSANTCSCPPGACLCILWSLDADHNIDNSLLGPASHGGRPASPHSGVAAGTPPMSLSARAPSPLAPLGNPCVAVSAAVANSKHFSCKWQGCNWSFDRHFDFKAHMNRHTGDKPYKCTVEGCDETFFDTSDRGKHEYKAHSSERRYQCSVCSKSFKEAKELASHTNRHTGNKPVACTVEGCGETFFDTVDQGRHLRAVHSSECHYQCSVCSQSFNSPKDLDIHNRGHTGEYLRCKTCNRPFKDPRHLARHELTHTGERPHSCERCHESFARTDTLRNHQRLRHGMVFPSKLKKK